VSCPTLLEAAVLLSAARALLLHLALMTVGAFLGFLALILFVVAVAGTR
jgi:hypothetical protein